jgi:hypothetical protein
MLAVLKDIFILRGADCDQYDGFPLMRECSFSESAACVFSGKIKSNPFTLSLSKGDLPNFLHTLQVFPSLLQPMIPFFCVTIPLFVSL